MGSLTRADLARAVSEETGWTQRDARKFVDAVFEAIMARLEAGETVKLTGFGSFNLRDKSERLGRNPHTLEAAPIAPRRVVIFRASHVLKKRIAKGLSGGRDGSPAESLASGAGI